MLLKCGVLHVRFDSCCLGSTLWRPSGWLRSRLSFGFHPCPPPRERDLSLPQREVPLGAGCRRCRCRLRCPQALLQQRMPAWGNISSPIRCCSCPASSLQHGGGLLYYSTTRKAPQGAYHPACPLLGLSPEAANKNQCKHIRLNGLFIFPTAAILRHHCLPNCNIAGQLAVQVCSGCTRRSTSWNAVLWIKEGEGQTRTPKSAALAMIFYKGLFYSTSVSPTRKRSLVSARSFPEEGYTN